jgi:hypothetical protein
VQLLQACLTGGMLSLICCHSFDTHVELEAISRQERARQQ